MARSNPDALSEASRERRNHEPFSNSISGCFFFRFLRPSDALTGRQSRETKPAAVLSRQDEVDGVARRAGGGASGDERAGLAAVARTYPGEHGVADGAVARGRPARVHGLGDGKTG